MTLIITATDPFRACLGADAISVTVLFEVRFDHPALKGFEMTKLAIIVATTLTAATLGASAMAQETAAVDFTKVDANADAMISWDEALAVYPTLTEDLFKQADANADGSLDEAEFTALVGLTAGAPDSGTSPEASSSAM